jgi:hypothetical protein
MALLLASVILFTNDNSIRTYDLEYQYYGTPKKSQLTSIQECTNNGRCLPKTKFRWNNKEASFGVNGKQWQALISLWVSVKHSIR